MISVPEFRDKILGTDGTANMASLVRDNVLQNMVDETSKVDLWPLMYRYTCE